MQKLSGLFLDHPVCLNVCGTEEVTVRECQLATCHMIGATGCLHIYSAFSACNWNCTASLQQLAASLTPLVLSDICGTVSTHSAKKPFNVYDFYFHRDESIKVEQDRKSEVIDIFSTGAEQMSKLSLVAEFVHNVGNDVFCLSVHTRHPPLRTLHLSHISSLMLAWCKEGTLSQVLSYSSVVQHLLLHNNIYCCTIYTGLVQVGLLCRALSPWA